MKINTPRYGNINIVADTFAELRTVPANKILPGWSAITNGGLTRLDGLGGIFAWNATSILDDDNETVIKPTKGLAQGRWEKIAVGQIGPQGIQGEQGEQGVPGPYGSEADKLAAEAAAAKAIAAQGAAHTARDVTIATRDETEGLLEETELARDATLAALTAENIFSDTTIAAAIASGLAAVSEGQTYYATGADVDYVGLFKDVSGSAVEQARIATSGALDDLIAEVDATVAGLPTGAATRLNGSGPPSANLGLPGAFYVDTRGEVEYGPKTSGGWGDGRPLSASIGASGYIWHDFSTATLPSYLTLTRPNGSTDAFYDDAPGRAYNTVSANQPVFWHGGLYRGGSSKNWFLNSTAPVTQSITLAAGTYALYGNGTGSLAATAGTAIGTFPGVALDLNDRTYQTFTVTTGGTVTITVTGTVHWVMVSNDGATPTKPTIGPLIVTTGAAVTRQADVLIGSGALLSMLQGSAGSFAIETSYVSFGANSNQSRLLSQNNNAILLLQPTSLTLWDGGSYFTSAGFGEVRPKSSDRTRWTFSFSPSGMSFAGGSRVPTTTSSYFWPSPTTVVIGGQNSGFDDYALNGVINRIGYRTSRPADTLLARETATFGLKSATPKLPIWEAAKLDVLKNTADAILFCWGTSHFTGTNPSTNTKATSWPTLLALLLTQAGIPAVSDSNFGNGSRTPSAGVSTYDSTVTLSSGITVWGSNPGGGGLRLGSGATIDKAVARATDTFKVYARAVAGSGTAQITVSLTGGGSATTFNVLDNNEVQTFSITVPRAKNNSFRIARTSGDPYIMGWIPSDTQSRVVQIVNGGMVANTAANLNDADCLKTVAALGAPLTIYGCATNDWTAVGAGSSALLSTYQATTTANIKAAQVYGDVLVLTDPPSSPTAVTPNVPLRIQAQYNNAEIAAANACGAPILDLFGAMTGGYPAWNGSGYYVDLVHLNAGWGYPMVADFVAGTVH